MLPSHWGYRIFGFSHTFTCFHTFLFISTTTTPFEVDFSPPWGIPRRQGWLHNPCYLWVTGVALNQKGSWISLISLCSGDHHMVEGMYSI